MRHKERDSSGSPITQKVNVWTYNWSTRRWYWRLASETDYDSKYEYESISYTLDPSRSRANSCMHRQASLKQKGLGYTCSQGNTKFKLENASHSWLTVENASGIHGSAPVPYLPTYTEVTDRFKQTDGAPQLLNFFAELTSAKALVKSAARRVNSLARSGGAGLKLPRLPNNRKVRRSIARDGFKKTAQRYLTYQFGVVAPVMDLIDAVEKVRTAGDRLREVYDQQGKPVQMVWSANATTSWDVPSNGTYHTGYTRFVSSCSAQRYIVAQYTLPRSSIILQDLTYFIDTLGLDNLVSAVYEGVPLSFVLDWFIPIGKNLRRIEPDIFQFQSFTLLEHFIQYKWETTFDGVIEDRPDVENFSAAGSVCFSGDSKQFVREIVYTPLKVVRFERGSGIDSKGKALTAGALVAVRS